MEIEVKNNNNNKNKNISNRRVYTYIAIISLAIFIIGIIAFGVFRFAKGSGESKSYYTYSINNSNLPDDPKLVPGTETFLLHTNIKYHELMTFVADNAASPGAYNHEDSYIFAGEGISFTLSIEEESYYLSEVVISKIMVSKSDPGEIYQLSKDQFKREYDKETKTFKVTLDDTGKTFVQSIELRYAVAKK